MSWLLEAFDQHEIGAALVGLGQQHVAFVGRDGQPGAWGIVQLRQFGEPSLDPILGPSFCPRLPLHIAWLVQAAALESDHMVDHITGAGTSRLIGGRTGILDTDGPASR